MIAYGHLTANLPRCSTKLTVLVGWAVPTIVFSIIIEKTVGTAHPTILLIRGSVIAGWPSQLL